MTSFVCIAFCFSVLPSIIPLTTGIDLNTRHGALLATAEITHALSLLAEQNGQTIADVIDSTAIEGMREITRKVREVYILKSVTDRNVNFQEGILATVSKLNHWLTGGSMQFLAVFIVLNNGNWKEPDGSGSQPPAEF